MAFRKQCSMNSRRRSCCSFSSIMFCIFLSVCWLLLLPVSAAAESMPAVSDDERKNRITIANMTCDFIEQPLDHFYIPAERSPTYKQRYCIYNGFVKPNHNKSQKLPQATTTPIFFYTGNESPLEQYINNTGLIWELAPEFHAQVVFVEHRYEGKSLPSPSNPSCLSYSSSKQAVEDYARFLEYFLMGSNDESLQRRPVIAFGGSYGGMLAAWFRMKYPTLVTGAIAASAPVWALPRTNPTRIDAAYQIITRGLKLPYPPTDIKKKKKNSRKEEEQDHHHHNNNNKNKNNHCVNNLLASWPLLQYLSQQTSSSTTTTTMTRRKSNNHKDDESPALAKLTEWFRLCQPLKKSDDVDALMEWIKTPWFDMAEGSFPYASSYIPFSLIKHNKNGTVLKLPPWPLQAACWNQSQLHQDWSIRMDGNTSEVRYNVTYGDDSNLTLVIDWDTMSPLNNNNVSLDRLLNSSSIEGLLTSVRDAVAVWYNITKEEPCFNLTPANNLRTMIRRNNKLPSKRGKSAAAVNENSKIVLDANNKQSQTTGRSLLFRAVDTTTITNRVTDYFFLPRPNSKKDDDKNATAECQNRIANEGSWNPLCCNENMNLIIYEAQGMGRDMIWPPNYPRGTTTHGDVIKHNARLSNETVPEFCLDPDNVFGYSQLPVDPWATQLDTYYGGTRIESFSNIIFSNGLLDPWTGGGVHVPWDYISKTSYDGPMVVPIGPKEKDLIGLFIEFGGHHTDLMYSDESDPECVTKARKIEKKYIAKWIQEAQR